VEEVGAASAGLIESGWAGRKLVGPLFDEIAEDWRQRYSDRRIRNLVRIGRNARRRSVRTSTTTHKCRHESQFA